MNITTIILITLAAICNIGLWLSIYMLYRNDKVCAFRKEILRMAGKESKRRIYEGRADFLDAYDILDKYSYGRMLFSIRPLKLEAWFTEKEIKELKR